MNKDNQQQTVSDFEVGWLAGIIEGEGSICLQIHRRNSRIQALRVTPKVIITNSDKDLMEKVAKILESIGIGKWVNHTKPNNVSTLFKLNGKKTPKFREMTYIHVSGMKRILALLKQIEPCIFGEKKERAQLLIKFIERRFEKSELFRCAGNYHYDEEDVANMLELGFNVPPPRIRNLSYKDAPYELGLCKEMVDVMQCNMISDGNRTAETLGYNLSNLNDAIKSAIIAKMFPHVKDGSKNRRRDNLSIK